jgi:hypothetical protein
MKKTKIEASNVLMKVELSKLKKENKKLSKKLEKSMSKTEQLQKALKKNDVRKVRLSKEQEQSLLNLSKDINIPNLLSD